MHWYSGVRSGNKIGGLAHIMLPDSTKIRKNLTLQDLWHTGIEELIRKVTANVRDALSGKNSRWGSNNV